MGKAVVEAGAVGLGHDVGRDVESNCKVEWDMVSGCQRPDQCACTHSDLQQSRNGNSKKNLAGQKQKLSVRYQAFKLQASRANGYSLLVQMGRNDRSGAKKYHYQRVSETTDILNTCTFNLLRRNLKDSFQNHPP